MKEITDILHTWRACVAQKSGAALATVVAVEGSSYRRPGARMLILRDSRAIGSISGGCIERDVIYRAGAIAGESGAAPMVVRYDSVSEEEAGPGATLGCGGTIDVLIESVGAGKDGDVLGLLDRLHTRRRRGVIATVIGQRNADAATGSHYLFNDDGSGESDEIPVCLIKEAKAALRADQSRPFRQAVPGGWVDYFLEVLRPSQELLIFGGGSDAQPLATFAQSLGWRVVIVDLRGNSAAVGREYDADEIMRCPAGDMSSLTISGDAAAIVMNHNWNHDLASLAHLARIPLVYLGVLGPRRRTERLLGHLGNPVPAARHFCYPIGLDIGAESPQEVALSIVAEILAVLRGGTGGSLRDKAGPIHSATAPAPTPVLNDGGTPMRELLADDSCPVAAS